MRKSLMLVFVAVLLSAPVYARKNPCQDTRWTSDPAKQDMCCADPSQCRSDAFWRKAVAQCCPAAEPPPCTPVDCTPVPCDPTPCDVQPCAPSPCTSVPCESVPCTAVPCLAPAQLPTDCPPTCPPQTVNVSLLDGASDVHLVCKPKHKKNKGADMWVEMCVAQFWRPL